MVGNGYLEANKLKIEWKDERVQNLILIISILHINSYLDDDEFLDP